MRSTHESHFVPPALMVLAVSRNNPQCQINMLQVLADVVLPAAAWSAWRSSPVCRWRFGLVDDSSKVVIRSSQNVTKSVNTAMVPRCSAGRSPAELLIGHKIEPVHLLDGSEGAMNAGKSPLVKNIVEYIVSFLKPHNLPLV